MLAFFTVDITFVLNSFFIYYSSLNIYRLNLINKNLLCFQLIWWLIALSHGDLDPKNNSVVAAYLNETFENPNWVPCVVGINSFASCFLFSIETQHTIGYGGRSTSEECPEAIFVMCIQSIVGEYLFH